MGITLAAGVVGQIYFENNILYSREQKHMLLFRKSEILHFKGNASCVLGTTGSMGKLEELNYL